MFSTLLSAAAFVATASAAFDPLSKNNVITYWGQGPNQQRLSEFCKDSTYDIINVGFVNVFPDQGKGGWPGTNFGNACYGDVYQNAAGKDTQLLKTCPNIGPDVIECQNLGKKIFLSIGGGADPTYYLKSAQSARNFANFLWAAYGPASAATSDVPRPWGDAGVDGFDFDIESFIDPAPSKPNNYQKAFYVDMITRFKKGLFPTDTSKEYYISGAPQCIIPDPHFTDVVAKAWFDFLFVQFYNTDGCSARDGIMKINGRGNTDISYLQWVAAKSLNPNVRISIGLPANKQASRLGKYWLNPTELQKLVKKFYGQKLFGGVMLWEATRAESKTCGTEYGTWAKNILNGRAAGKDIATTCANKRDLSEYDDEKPETTSTSCTQTSTITRSRSSSVPSASPPVYTAPGNWSIPAHTSSHSKSMPPAYTSPAGSPGEGVPSSPASSYPASPEQSSPSESPSEAAPSSPADSYPTSPAESSPAASSPASPEYSSPAGEACGDDVTVTVTEQSTVYVTATATEGAPSEDVTSLTTIQSTSTIYNTHTAYLTRYPSESAPAGGAPSGSASSPSSPEESAPSDYENSPVGGEGSSSSAPAAPAYSGHGHQHGQGQGHNHGHGPSSAVAGPHGGEEAPQSTTTVVSVVTVVPVPVSSEGAAQPTEAPYPYGPAMGNGTAGPTGTAAPSASAPAWPSYGVPQQTGGAGAVGVSATLMTAVALLAVILL